MKKSFFTTLSVLLIAMLVTTTAYAGGLKLSGTSFSLGSLISNGTATGLGGTTWYLKLQADGTAMTVCVNQGGNAAPGQNYPHVQGIASQTLAGDSNTRHNGKSPFGVETGDNYNVSWSDAGCPNSNWTAQVVFVFWNHATITLDDNADFSSPDATFDYCLKTTYTGPSNPTTPVFTDGTVQIVPCQ